jgi:hypothetical protein
VLEKLLNNDLSVTLTLIADGVQSLASIVIAQCLQP